MSTKTEYTPGDWMDEIVSPMVEDPRQLIVQGGDTGWMLSGAAVDADDDDEFYRTILKPGDVVEFWARRIYDDVEIEVAEDGTYEVLGDYPADATHFAHEDADWDGYCSDVASLIAEGNPEEHGTPLPVGRHLINVWHWSSGHLYQFEVISGAGILAEIGQRQ